MPLDPGRNLLFFFSISNSRLWLTQFSTRRTAESGACIIKVQNAAHPSITASPITSPNTHANLTIFGSKPLKKQQHNYTRRANASMIHIPRAINNNNNNRILRCNLRFSTISSLCHEPSSNTYAEVARAQSCANHMQHIERLSRATCHVTCHVVRRDSLTECKSHLF